LASHVLRRFDERTTSLVLCGVVVDL